MYANRAVCSAVCQHGCVVALVLFLVGASMTADRVPVARLVNTKLKPMGT